MYEKIKSFEEGFGECVTEKPQTNSENSTASPCMSSWKKLASAYHSMCCTRAKTKGRFVKDQDAVTYLFLGLSAATGKVINEAKKFYRGDSDTSHDKLENALASVRICTEQLAIELHVNLDFICEKHMIEIMNRVDGKFNNK